MKAWTKILVIGAFFAACLCGCIKPVYADTDGTELQIVKPSVLEIQLGPQWSGVSFQLKTDVGMYPAELLVGEDGILRLEIGGSTYYGLSCMKPGIKILDPERDDERANKEVDMKDMKTEPARNFRVTDTASDIKNT